MGTASVMGRDGAAYGTAPLMGDSAAYGGQRRLWGRRRSPWGKAPYIPLSAVGIKAAAVIARAVGPYVLSLHEFYV